MLRSITALPYCGDRAATLGGVGGLRRHLQERDGAGREACERESGEEGAQKENPGKRRGGAESTGSPPKVHEDQGLSARLKNLGVLASVFFIVFMYSWSYVSAVLAILRLESLSVFISKYFSSLFISKSWSYKTGVS